MTLPTKTLLDQLRGEVEWLDNCRLFVLDDFERGIEEHGDHATAALDIIEELEGRESERKKMVQEYWEHTMIHDMDKALIEILKGDLHRLCGLLRRLHDLIKGNAPREAMELLRSMIGG